MVRRALGVGAAALAGLAAIAGRPSPTPRNTLDVAALLGEIERETDHVSAIELAEWIRDRKPGLRVLDVRTAAEYEQYHIPSAEHAPLAAIARLRPRDDETLVLYSEGGAHAAQAWVFLRAAGARRVYFLRGGVLDWLGDVMNPALGTSGAEAERARAVSRYFGGVPRASGDTTGASHDAASAVSRVRRRGC